MPAAPASNNLFMIISSFDGSLTRGREPARSTVLIRFSASNKSITLCSISIVNQSKPAFEKISVIAGCAKVTQVPSVSSLLDNFFLSLCIFSFITIAHHNSVIL